MAKSSKSIAIFTHSDTYTYKQPDAHMHVYIHTCATLGNILLEHINLVKIITNLAPFDDNHRIRTCQNIGFPSMNPCSEVKLRYDPMRVETQSTSHEAKLCTIDALPSQGGNRTYVC